MRMALDLLADEASGSGESRPSAGPGWSNPLPAVNPLPAARLNPRPTARMSTGGKAPRRQLGPTTIMRGGRIVEISPAVAGEEEERGGKKSRKARQPSGKARAAQSAQDRAKATTKAIMEEKAEELNVLLKAQLTEEDQMSAFWLKDEEEGFQEIVATAHDIVATLQHLDDFKLELQLDINRKPVSTSAMVENSDELSIRGLEVC